MQGEGGRGKPEKVRMFRDVCGAPEPAATTVTADVRKSNGHIHEHTQYILWELQKMLGRLNKVLESYVSKIQGKYVHLHF